MNKYRRWYNQNRKSVWITIGIIALIIGLIQLVNSFYRIRNEQELAEGLNQIQNTTNDYNYNNVRVDQAYSSLTGEQMSTGQKNQIEVIDDFVQYCNENNLQSAYDLLTNDCKEEMYPTLEIFQESYYNQIFNNETKNISVENWINNIYKVKINEDFLSTGTYSKENTIQDYITVVQENDEYKLNINSFIGTKEINKSKESNGIQIEVLEEKQYMDYQVFKMRIKNNSENNICLDDGKDIKAMYIEDDNGLTYSAYTHEIAESILEFSPRETREIEIKYYSKFSSERKISKVVFSRMILDYKTSSPKYNNYIEIQI